MSNEGSASASPERRRFRFNNSTATKYGSTGAADVLRDAAYRGYRSKKTAEHEKGKDVAMTHLESK